MRCEIVSALTKIPIAPAYLRIGSYALARLKRAILCLCNITTYNTAVTDAASEILGK